MLVSFMFYIFKMLSNIERCTFTMVAGIMAIVGSLHVLQMYDGSISFSLYQEMHPEHAKYVYPQWK